MHHRTPNYGSRTRVLQDPGPARPVTIFCVGILAGLFLALGLAMVRHHFLRSESYNYYSEHVSTPWHFEAKVAALR